ncbi:hypothetical protein GJ744_001316 [Endocarpon pusillum]|uniref:Uncharacterized protein n=1 Tax=Endocarpon pusillum TaxID=364733 RepID=A0A8H7A6S0_9EURO|nr:hypothetical protein GJ744_001316 [Endocarpon pusillum]
MEKQIANAVRRAIGSEATRTVTKACDKIRSRVVGPRANSPTAKGTLMLLRRKWVRQTVSEDTWRYEVLQQTAPSSRKPQFKREIQRAIEEGDEAR